jgi:DNA-binding PadR family transcriptional regulator
MLLLVYSTYGIYQKEVIIMSLRHGLLGLVSSEGSMTGYDLDKFFKNSLKLFWHATTSQIYRELNAMEKSGWLASERVVQEDKPNKKVYTITSEGKEELLRWLETTDITNESAAKNPLLMKIFFAGEMGEQGLEQMLKLLEECKLQGMAFIETMNNIVKMLDEDEKEGKYTNHIKYWRIVALSGQISAKRQIEWVEQSIAILQEEGK